MKNLTRLPHLIFAALFFLAQPTTGKEAAYIPDEVMKAIQARVQDGTYVGVVVGIVNSKGSHYFSFGSLSLTDTQTPDEHTVYEIGSITKAFTSILLADMVVKNELNLNDPISKHLSQEISVPSHSIQHITLEHLATHTSALPRLPSNLNPGNPNNPYADYSVDKMYSFLANYSLPRAVGKTYEYSNYGTGLLGHILSLHNDSSYEQLFKNRIADVIGLNETGITLTPSMQSRLAKGSSGGLEAENWDLPALAGAGALRSTAHDMLLFIAANMGLHKSSLYPAMLMTHKTRITDGAGESVHVGLGWHIRSNDDVEVIWHNGGTGGYRGFAGFLRGGDMGVVVLTNTTESVDDIGFHLLDPSFPLQEGNPTIEVTSEVLETYVGKYQLTPAFFITISTDGDKLMAQATGQNQFQVFPVSETRFFYKVVDAQITFNLNGEGTVKSLTLHQNGQNVPGTKID
jgi:CubicO group peptidase (beta-lactamase class C family)